MKCIFGLEDVSKGEIIFNNEKVYGPSRNLVPGNAAMKLVSQDFYVLDFHTVSENITDKLAGYEDTYKQKRLNQLLKILDLKKIKDSKASILSAGQKQRVSISRALAEFPEMLLLDEPFSNLDFALKDGVISYIRSALSKNKSSCILVTHQPDEALRYSDFILVMEEGKIIGEGTPKSLYHYPENMRIASLFGKCVELEKSDFKSTTALKIGKNKIIARPEYFSKVAKKDSAHMEGEITGVFFCGDKWEVTVDLESETEIVFYSYFTKPEVGEKVFLKLKMPI